MAELTPHEVRVVRRPYPATPDGITPSARRTADLGIGILSLSTNAFRDALDRFLPTAIPRDQRNPSAARQLSRAATGIALVAEQRAMDAAEALERVTQRSVDTARQVPIVRDVLIGFEASITRWAERGDVERARRQAVVTEFVSHVVPAIIQTVLERVDFGAVVARIPLAEIVGGVDLEAVMREVDLNAVLAHIDVDAILRQVDIDALLARIDVDGLMSRVDLDALLGRMELGPIVADVLDDVDIGAIVRESTGSISGDAVDGARLTAMRLDSFVGRVADRVLLRGKNDRNPSEPAVESGPTDTGGAS